MSIFKKGDNVYHWQYGRGVVASLFGDDIPIPMVFVTFGLSEYGVKEEDLSFTEYIIEKKNFSQERPVDKKATMLVLIEQLILGLPPFSRRVYCLINKSDYLDIVSSVISSRGVMGLGDDGFSNDYKDFTYNHEGYTAHFICSDFVKSGEFKILKNLFG